MYELNEEVEVRGKTRQFAGGYRYCYCKICGLNISFLELLQKNNYWPTLDYSLINAHIDNCIKEANLLYENSHSS